MFPAFFIPLLIVFSPPGPKVEAVNFESRFGPFTGAFILREVGGGEVARYGGEACKKRLAPCSTFKIVNALIGLESGVLKDENTLFKWDGKPKYIKAWERDHTLASAIKESCLWYFQEVARRVGPERMKAFIDKIGYGNEDISGGIDLFWLDRSLQVSAEEQVTFLEKLYTGRLPFSETNVTLVKRLLVHSSGDCWTLSGKTGSALTEGKGSLGWYVGHLRSDGREYVFALNIEAKDGASGAIARQMVIEILKDAGMMPR
ncbi:MAG TPA: penicillin-binding transpeptidase domain-containing protein [Phycisphaerae bacterium]|nr:penicillin-binding transpeptidase domain-containing protein [Phycisphaerae bacterium]